MGGNDGEIGFYLRAAKMIVETIARGTT